MTAKEARETALKNFKTINRDIMSAIYKAVSSGLLSCEVEVDASRYENVKQQLTAFGYEVRRDTTTGMLIIKFN